jgi:hypothetical protein
MYGDLVKKITALIDEIGGVPRDTLEDYKKINRLSQDLDQLLKQALAYKPVPRGSTPVLLTSTGLRAARRKLRKKYGNES